MESNILVIRDWNWKIRINVIESSRERNREKRVAFIALFRFCCRGKKKEERRKKPIVIFSNFPNWTRCTSVRVKGVSRLFGKRGSNSGKANRTKRRSPSLPPSLPRLLPRDGQIGRWNNRQSRTVMERAERKSRINARKLHARYNICQLRQEVG